MLAPAMRLSTAVIRGTSRRTASAWTFNSTWRSRRRLATLLLAGLLLVPATASAGRVTLAWDPSPDPVAGYTVDYGTAPNSYTLSVTTTQTTATITGLSNGVRYYFRVRAFSSSGVYSAGSNEVNGLPFNQVPTITNPGAQTNKAGAFTLTLAASDPDGDALTFSAPNGLPSGLTLHSSTGTLSGTVAAGTYSITVAVSDGALSASAAFTLTVTANTAPTLQTPASQSNDLDDVVSLQVSASDADGDALTYSAAGLPPGLSINATSGRITGTPTAPGTYSVTVGASDGASTASGTFAWTVTGAPAPQNPISHWKFDEGSGTSAADAAGGMTGTLTNGAGWTSGHFGSAVLLDGSNDYVAMPAFDVTGSAVTISTWARVGSFAQFDQRFIAKTADQTDYWTLSTSGQALRMRLRTGGVVSVTSTATLPLNTWFHAVTTYDGATVRLYLDGVQVGSTAATGAIATSPSGVVNIGRSPAGTNYLNGAVDDVRIFARALSAVEVAALYNEVASTPPPPPPPPVSFTDDPLLPGVHGMRLVHIQELRARIDLLRAGRGLSAAVWTPLVAGVSTIRASHIAELRSALDAVYTSLGLVRPGYSDAAVTPGMAIRAVHITELRAAIRALP